MGIQIIVNDEVQFGIFSTERIILNNERTNDSKYFITVDEDKISIGDSTDIIGGSTIISVEKLGNGFAKCELQKTE